MAHVCMLCWGACRRALLTAQLWGTCLTGGSCADSPEPGRQLALWHHSLPDSSIAQDSAPKGPGVQSYTLQHAREPAAGKEHVLQQSSTDAGQHPQSTMSEGAAVANGTDGGLQDGSGPEEGACSMPPQQDAVLADREHMARILDRMAGALDYAAGCDRLHGARACVHLRMVFPSPCLP